MSNKYSYFTILQGNYGHGFEDLMCYETNSKQVAKNHQERKDFKENVKLYKSEDGYARAFRIIRRRELNN